MIQIMIERCAKNETENEGINYIRDSFSNNSHRPNAAVQKRMSVTMHIFMYTILLDM